MLTKCRALRPRRRRQLGEVREGTVKLRVVEHNALLRRDVPELGVSLAHPRFPRRRALARHPVCRPVRPPRPSPARRRPGPTWTHRHKRARTARAQHKRVASSPSPRELDGRAVSTLPERAPARAQFTWGRRVGAFCSETSAHKRERSVGTTSRSLLSRAPRKHHCAPRPRFARPVPGSRPVPVHRGAP